MKRVNNFIIAAFALFLIKPAFADSTESVLPTFSPNPVADGKVWDDRG